MEPYTIEFLDVESYRNERLIPEVYSFKRTGVTGRIQQIMWNILQRLDCLKPAYTTETLVRKHVVDSDKVLNLILKQDYSLKHRFNRSGQTLLIGTEDYFNLIGEVVIPNAQFQFNGDLNTELKVFGLTIKVIPWMRGILVMP